MALAGEERRMKMRMLLMTGVLLPAALSAQAPTRLAYPETAKQNVADDYHGTRIADPYRWLEDPNSPETKAWVEAQNRVTFAYLERLPARGRIRARLTELWDYERYGVPSKEGPRYVFTRNDGLQNQAVVYQADTLDAQPRILLDPNTLSPDGTVALTSMAFTDDGRHMAYGISSGGSDWIEWHVRDVTTGRDLPEVLKWSKFSGASWLKDGSGFFYSRYDAPKDGEAYSGVNKHHKVYFHQLGTTQDQDALVYARPDKPEWGFSAEVTDDGRFLVILQWEGTNRENRVFVKDLQRPDARIEPFLDEFDASYEVVGNDDRLFYLLTDKDAGRNRLVGIPLGSPDPAGWRTVIAELPGRDVIGGAEMIGDRFIVTVRTDAHDTLRVYGKDGSLEREVPLPALGSIGAVEAKRRDAEAFYAFTSFTFPTTIYRYDPATGKSSVFKQPRVKFSPDAYETRQLFYTSKDGTRIPMFVVHKKGLVRDGQTPTLLYGYGGFDASLTPAFSPAIVGWLELGGMYAQPNLRGGGEYGKEWHDAGRLDNKQNVFDDFIAAAEYLIRDKYTSTPRLAINGGSNGGLLVGAALTQRPDLFGAAVSQVGVLDMLRFHKFTIGWAWTSDYGSADTKKGFETLIEYSPLHNIKPGTKYPATLITTGDHDDRVVPAHSHKFTAALQAAQGGPAPILTRIETRAGHGAGKPTTKQIEERGDIYAFLAHVLRMPGAGGTN
jgi:prolyl oligopeptidase